MFEEPDAAGVMVMKSGANPGTETAVAEPPEQNRERRYRQAAELLREWKDDETGYDDEVWPLMEADLPSLWVHCSE